MASLVRASRARMLTPISSLGATPIMAARERFTRRTLSVSSWTTMKSVMASKISSQWRFDLFDASEQARIFQGHGGVPGNGFEQVAVFGGERTSASGEAEQTGEVSVGSGKSNHYQVVPAKLEARSGPSSSAAEPETMASRPLRGQLRKGLRKSLLQRAIFGRQWGAARRSEIVHPETGRPRRRGLRLMRWRARQTCGRNPAGAAGHQFRAPVE